MCDYCRNGRSIDDQDLGGEQCDSKKFESADLTAPVGTYKVREYLAEQGYEILAEDMVLEEGKFYPIMKVCPGSPYTLTKEEACYGKELLSQRHSVLQSFLHRELDMKRKVLRELDDKSGDHICQRREALQKETACVEGILGQWESGGKQKK